MSDRGSFAPRPADAYKPDAQISYLYNGTVFEVEDAWAEDVAGDPSYADAVLHAWIAYGESMTGAPPVGAGVYSVVVVRNEDGVLLSSSEKLRLT